MNLDHARLILFTRYPIPGRAKTRLIPVLGPLGAAALQRRLTLRALRTARTFQGNLKLEIEIRYDGGSERAMQHWLGQTAFLREQGPGDLGQRMDRAFEDSFREGSTRTVIIGSDCPDMQVGVIEQAFESLRRHQVVLGPAKDGGYYLIGLNKPVPELFAGIEWGTHTVMDRSRQILKRLQIAPGLLDPLDDLDRPEDVPRWRRTLAVEEEDLHRVSVIIPARNEAANLVATVASIRQDKPREIILVDGGSTDETLAIAKDLGVFTLASLPGRAAQMNAGAALATGNTLLFLHADTHLPEKWVQVIANVLAKPRVAAGAFRFKLRGHFRGRRLTEVTTNWRSRWLQHPYGDQTLFLRRALFEELGGYADLPIMEDFELARRLRRHGRIVTLPEAAVTSGRRWQRSGLLRTVLTNQAVVTGYHLGVAPARLRRLYDHLSR